MNFALTFEGASREEVSRSSRSRSATTGTSGTPGTPGRLGPFSRSKSTPSSAGAAFGPGFVASEHSWFDGAAEPHWSRPLTPFLLRIQDTSRFRFTAYGGISCFWLYFFIYAYRRPFLSVLDDTEQWTDTMKMKDAIVTAQTLGFLVAKIYGI